MASITEQHRDVYKLAIGMYAAAPGMLYLGELNGALAAGMTVSDVYRALANAPSFHLQHPGFGPQATNTQFTNAFLDRVLGTEVTPQARQVAFSFIADRLAAGVTRADVMKLAMDALDAVSTFDPDFGAAARRLHNRIEAAREFTETLNGSSPDIAFLQNTIATVTSDPATREAAMDRLRSGNTFVLTPGADSGAAFIGGFGPDVFSAATVSDSRGVARQTLNSGDVLDGGRGIDTLKAVIAEQPAAPFLRSIENLELRFTGSHELSLANASEVEQVMVERSSALGVVTDLGAVNTLVVRDQNKSVVFDASDAPALRAVLEKFGNLDTTPDLVLGAAEGLKAESVDFALTDAHAHVNLHSPGVTNIGLDVSGENTFSLDGPGIGTEAITLTITGSGSVDVSGALPDVTAIVGTAATGAIDLTVGDNMTSIATGRGPDTVTYTEAILRAPRIDLGAGDDVLTLNGATASGALISGGLGKDTLEVANGAWIDAAAKTIYTGFETLEVGGGQGTYVMSLLPQVKEVTVTDTAPAQDVKIVEAAPETSISFTGTFSPFVPTLSFELADTTGSKDKLHVNLDSTDSISDGDVVPTPGMHVALAAPGIEILDIASNILDPELPRELSSNHLGLVNADQLRTVTVTGDAHLVLGLHSTMTAISRIDASQSTGGIDYGGMWSQGQSLTFIGSTARDMFGASMHGDVINASGNGDWILLRDSDSVDRLIYAAGDSVFTALPEERFDTVINFVGASTDPALADKIDLESFGFIGAERSALLDKGLTLGPLSGLRLPSQPDWFVSDGQAHAVATAADFTADPSNPLIQVSTYVFVDANRNGDWDVATDLFIVLAGTPDVNLNNFVF
jgi:hypothetical protein